MVLSRWELEKKALLNCVKYLTCLSTWYDHEEVLSKAHEEVVQEQLKETELKLDSRQ